VKGFRTAIAPRLLMAEGKREESIRSLHDVIGKLEALRARHREDLTAAWHSWPGTSFTRREEQKDLSAAGP
jgi:hypothetical protein